MLSPPSFHSLSQTPANLSDNYAMNNLNSTTSKNNVQAFGSVTFITMTTRNVMGKGYREMRDRIFWEKKYIVLYN